MKKKIFMALALVAAITSLTACKKSKVNGTLVSMKGAKVTAQKYYDEIKEDRVALLIDMIDHQLFDEKYKTTDAEQDYVDEKIQELIEKYSNGDRKQFESLVPTYFGVDSIKDLEKQYSLEYKREQAVKDYLKDHLTDSEIESYYKNYVTGDIKALHILIEPKVDEKASDTEKKEAEEKAKKKAQSIIKELDSGADFAKLAKKYSDDDATKSKGGDLDYFDPNDMEEAFANAVRDLKKNEYTNEPIKTSYGFHIILKKDEKDKPELDDVKDKIKKTLAEQKLDEDDKLIYQTLIDIRKDKKIKWNDSKMKKAYNDYVNKLAGNDTDE
jgi:foldase protein PrsA